VSKDGPKTLFASVNLIGDTITQTPALRAYRELYPQEEIHWVIQDDSMRLLFANMPDFGVCDRVLFDNDWERIRAMEYQEYQKRFLMDVQAAFRIGAEKNIHMAQAYGEMIGVYVPTSDILPTVPVRPADVDAMGVPPHCLVISPRSSSNAPKGGFAGNKNLPWKAWPAIVDLFVKTGRIENHVVLIRDNDPEPEVPMCVLRMSLVQAAAYIAKASAEGGAYCGVDNGMTHIAAGLRVPTFCVYSAGMADSWAGYSGFSHYHIAKTLPYECDVEQIWEQWKNRLS
jgi:ADP-heptose:LPS heptosyltransferase